MPDQNSSLFNILLERASQKWRDVKEKTISTIGSSSIPRRFLHTDPMEEVDKPFLHQFLNPQKDVLPLQTLRPTKLDKIPDLPFRSTGVKPNPYSAIIEDTLPGGDIDIEPPFADAAYAMGHYKKSIGHDEQGNPYLSVYDVWDFDSPVVGNTIGKLLNRTGQPFAVYDRFPIEPSDHPDFEDTPELRGHAPSLKHWKFKGGTGNVTPQEVIPGPNAWWNKAK